MFNIKRILFKRIKSSSIHKIKNEEIIADQIKTFKIVWGWNRNQFRVKWWIEIMNAWTNNLKIWDSHVLLKTISILNNFQNLNKLDIVRMLLYLKIYKMILINKVTNRIFLLITISDPWIQIKPKKQ